MCKHRTLWLTCLLLVFTLHGLFAQITISSTSGCLPNGITNAIFTYVGSGTPSNISWNFGDGTPVSTQNPTQHSYPNVGTYTVTFSATVGGNQVTHTATVAVYPQPTGAFTAPPPTVRCAPMTVSFTGTSPVSSVIYKWDFGDGNIAQGNPVTHAYNSQGNFTPILTVQNTLTGCFVNITGNVLNVSTLPTILVSINPGIATCGSSLNASFSASGSTSGSPLPGGALSYNWNFGSFGNASGVTPSPVLFQPQGTYPVTLTVTDNNSCSSNTIIPITLLSPSVLATVPQQVCVASQASASPTAPFFTVTVQSNIPSTTWDMGDGSPPFSFPLPIPPSVVPPALFPNTPYTGTIYAYSTPGLKTITITATTGTCVAAITRTVMVESITPSFVALPDNYSCNSTFSLGFLNQTTVNTNSSLSYTWTTKHWTGLSTAAYTTTAVNPTINVTQNSTNPYVVYQEYRPTTFLNVKSALGCTVGIQQTLDTIFRPTAFFFKDKREGCAPLVVNFSDASNFDNLYNVALNGPHNPITSYTWNAGDGTTTVTGPGPTIPMQTFTYSSPGTYTPFLTIQTALGCQDVSFIDTIIVVNPPTLSYTVPTGSICAGQSVTVNMAAASSNTIQHWHVQSDAGYFSGCISDNNPVWPMTHPGVHNFTLSIYQNRCMTSTVSPQTVTVTGPVARFRFETQCTGNKKTVKFYCYVNDASGATLNFGDGSSVVPIANTPGSTTSTLITHTYPATGDFTASIVATHTNGCPPTTFTQVVRVREPVADFSIFDDVICKSNGLLALDASNSQDVMVSCSMAYTWILDNDTVFSIGTPGFTVYSLNDNFVGTHTVTLRIKDINNCVDKMTKTFRVSHPQPNFSFNHNPICVSDYPLQMTNLAPQSPDSIKKFWYNMGNGVFNGVSNTILTNLISPSHTYSPTYSYNMGNTQTMTFTVTQIVQNVEGCIDSVKKTVTVNNPQINFGAFNQAACVNQPLVFGIIAGPTHTNYNIYFGDSLAFNTNAYNSNMVYYRAHAYPLPGVYTPTAALTDNAGCLVTTTLLPITVEPYPIASFTLCNYINSASGTDFCMPFTSSLTSTSQYGGTGNLMYYWDLGKGDPTTITQSSVAGTTFTNTGTYTASLTVMSPLASCASSSAFTFKLFDPKIDFKVVPDTAKKYFCLGEPITVSVTTSNGSQYFIWDFGDGVVRPKVYLPAPAPMLNSVYTNTYFPTNTNGELTIEVTGYAGSNTTGTVTTAACKDAKRKKLNIIQITSDFKRNDEIDLSDYRHCLGEPDRLEAQSTTNSTATVTYTWNYGDGTSGFINPSGHLYSLPGTYTIELKSNENFNNCTATISKTMQILPLPNASLTIDNSACPGTPFVIAGTGTPGVSGTLTGTLAPGVTFTTLQFDSLNAFTTTLSAQASTNYSLTVSDNNGCKSAAATASIFIQPSVPKVNWDTTVVIGQITPLNAYLGEGYTYTWTPEVTWLNCDTCLFYNPVSSTTVDITYTVMVEDSLQCSVEKNTYRIKVNPVISIDVPTAFTPNGDGINDLISPNGWGLRKLIYFRVFNRWGQLVFESTDLNVGWNGYYQGVPQNMETYVYQVSAETYLDSEPVITKTGTFKLLR